MANRDDDGHVIEMGGRGGDDQRSSSVAAEPAISNQRRTASSAGAVADNSPFESGIWLCLQLVVSVIQIVASISVLWMSKRNGGEPDPKLFSWLLGYACACFLIIPLLCCRFLLRGSTLSLWRYGAVEILKMSLSCCFAIWFLLGCVWVFGTSFSGDQNTKLETLCLVLLASGCIMNALPFMRGAMLCMLLPCLILPTLASPREQAGGGGEGHNDGHGIPFSTLPIYKLLKQQNGELLLLLGAAGSTSTDHHHHKQRPISAEDAVCCICLGKYEEEEVVRELPCTHFFHVDCVDKWLNINARCPLCLSQIPPAPHRPRPSTSPTHSHDTNHNPITETAA